MANHINTNRIHLAGYRVVARHRDGRESSVTLAENARQAAFLAKAFCAALEASGRRDGIVSVRIEEWVGFLNHGKWRTVTARPARTSAALLSLCQNRGISYNKRVIR